ncbi:MAG: methylmalonyl Co-A mutase-associated GTPase MeaB [Actinomycetales bacterium]|jgi:LAO/AO transport system kinase|uniref:Methylmalonyl Co-A mutase-associated GTPase MeaB n=1 Tax=Candidatus Phosphoribacter hodrii TaxID=2953743 RepID=A0A935M8H2_9MICO|nr:methylmalonyl Co-A mutase-associated GTPase MeaB [Candidatus Phosphoribacter hodrii]HNV15721.1 methylmalonyl Co-A mutase-associated GTPase MeaB [Dermatophilaceae bacterium]MBL0005290.1 methylmalonyl Co-A mutase-associated GTPase MeaB [Candidatus Phosphoribacter hodrii]HOA59295.1 methylmalonyl Co-A mutase-associated GTPase MeaB [Dermatophilaceae bacterium]HOF37758.1 methylmalonyl Co-A mutase-associated GTPase MeaB [Dermatophilaceae bacterium]
MPPRPVDVPALVTAARAGSPRAVARLISLVEDAHPALREVMAALAPHTGKAHVIGLTGSPGVGKSTSTSALVAAFRARGKRVGILAVDPSSPFSGGALLGDRVRMQEHALDPEVYIRSMASRGHLGGLAWTTPQAIRVLDAAGCEVVLVETVGVGQSEVEIAGLADTTIVLLAPGMGDGIQAAKAGILEIGDVFVVNKADRDGADATVRDLRHMISLGDRTEPGLWRPPVCKTVASRGEGLDEVMEAIDKHEAWLDATGTRHTRRLRRASDEIEAIALAALRARMGDLRAGHGIAEHAAAVVAGTTDPYAAADDVVAHLA